MVELLFEQDESAYQTCSLVGSYLGKDSHRRTVRRLEEQHLLDSQKQKMDSKERRRSNKVRKSQVERRFTDRNSHRDVKMLHIRSLPRPETEIELIVVTLNALTLPNLEKRKLPTPT